MTRPLKLTATRLRIEQYLDHLGSELRLACSHQLFAFSVLRFVYRHVLRSSIVLDSEAALMQRLSDKIDQLGHSDKTDKTYSQHVLDFFRFHRIKPWQSTQFVMRAKPETERGRVHTKTIPVRQNAG